MTDTFYSRIHPVDAFEAVAAADSYVTLPDDWWIVAADVVDSTTAISAGAYKVVNSIGVAVIAAVTNCMRPTEVPYVFGGDGALLCIPGGKVEPVGHALAATVAMAAHSFELELRAAIVPVTYLRTMGHDVLVARHRVSPQYDQCAFYGGGVEYAERELKQGGLPDEYVLQGDPSGSADYSGLECRWAEVPSPSEETVAVIIDATSTGAGALGLYRRIVSRIEEIYGGADQCRPVTEEGLRATLSSAMLSTESRLGRGGVVPSNGCYTRSFSGSR